MASYHLSVKTVQRSAGRSATAAAAYRHAERIECQREGRVHDYRAKSGVEHSFIVAPEDAPEWAQDRQALWNAAEARENRRDSVVAREWELALPHELGAAERRALVEGFARELVARYRVAADVAIHAPHREGDQRNWHAHVLTTTRVLEREGLTDKTKVLDAKQTGGPEITHMRERWAEMQNHALEREGHEARVSHRTLALQREEALRLGHEREADNLDRAPEMKLGPVVSGLERREERAAEREGREYVPLTERGAQVHEARQARSLLEELGRVRDALREEVRERAALAREIYAQAREEGTDRVRAGLAALRAAVERQGLAREGRGLAQGLEHGLGHGPSHSPSHGLGHASGEDRSGARERDGPGHGAEGESIEARLARLLGRGEAAERTPALRDGVEAVREELARLRERDMSRTPRSHEAIYEELERLREQESHRAHEATRERLTEALERLRSTERESERTAEREAPTHRVRGLRARGHGDDGHGWGL